jgi:hypothetical protein
MTGYILFGRKYLEAVRKIYLMVQLLHSSNLKMQAAVTVQNT